MSSSSATVGATYVKPDRNALFRLVPFARPALPALTLGIITAMAASLVALSIPLVIEWVIAGPIENKIVPAIIGGAAAVLGLGLLEAFFAWLRRKFIFKPVTGVELDMRTTIYAKLQSLPVAFHDKWQSGQLLSRMMQDLNLIRRWMAFGITFLIVNTVMIVVGSVFLFRWHWLLGASFLVTSLPLWYVGYRFENRYGELSRRSQDQAGDLATSVEESVHGIRVLKAFGRGGHSLNRFTKQARQLRETELEKASEMASIWGWLTFVPQMALVVNLVLGVWLVTQGQLTQPQLVAYFAMVVVLRWPIESIGFLFAFTLDARTATERVFEIYDAVDTITSPENPVSLDAPAGRLTFENAQFEFQDAREGERPILADIDLEIMPGETMALVGLTGSGKTTLTALPTRLYDVTGGAVKLDGVDVRRFALPELRKHISMAFEDATLFSLSVRDNVLLGRQDLEPGSAEADAVLQQALEVAQASFVGDLPEGADTVIGEEGMSLSGGQRQRLALARAVAAAPKVIVMDDPLSALDVDTEALVEEALRHVLAGTTAMIVAHRPSTVALADRVAVLENGRISAVGSHAELMKTSEHYRYVISSLENPDTALTQDEYNEQVATGAITIGPDLAEPSARASSDAVDDQEGVTA